MPIHYITINLPRSQDAFKFWEKIEKELPETIDLPPARQDEGFFICLPDNFVEAKNLAESWLNRADWMGFENVSVSIYGCISVASILASPLKNKYAVYEKTIRDFFSNERLEIIPPSADSNFVYVNLFGKNISDVQEKFRSWLNNREIQKLICKTPSYNVNFKTQKDCVLWSMHQKELLEKELREQVVSTTSPRQKPRL